MGITDDIRRLLEADKRSKAEICRLTGLTEAAISNFRAGKKSFSTESLERLAAALGYELTVKRKRK